MNIRFITNMICIASVALSTAVLAQAMTLTESQRADGEAKIALAGKLLANSLRDTDGTKFRNVFLRKTTGKDGNEHVGLCGEVNSRNGYGGMSGFHSFMLIADKVYVGGRGQIINADEICTNGRGVFDIRDYSPEVRKALDANAGQ